VEGTGPAVAEGEKVFVHYLGQTWAPKEGKANVFDNSYDRGEPFNFAIGQGNVIPGWDNGLLGLKAGTRVLLAIAAKDAYGQEKVEGQELSGEALVFVVDVIGSTAMTATADGTPTTSVPEGLPTVASEPGKEPSITSVKGVTAPAAGQPGVSALLLEGTGEAIDPDRRLVLQLVQADLATGQQTQKTWGGEGPQLVAASEVISTITAFKDAKVGSRAVLVTPRSDQQGSLAVVVDVVGQL
jgi:peptidylprolyl isomerase